MAKRFTDTEKWDKEWYMKLPCKLKCLVDLVRDKCDLSGVWSPNWILAKNYVGEKVTEQELLSIDNGNQFVKIESGKIFCVGFIEFQYGQILSEKSPVHRKVLSILNTHKIDYKYPINRVQEEEEEEDKEEEKDKEKEEEKESAENLKVITHEKVIFENFRIKYPGVKKGLDTEFLNFQKKHKDWKEVVHILESKLNNQIHWRQLTKGFVPEWKHLQTWINQRDWEIEVENIQLISNNTSNGQPKFGGKLDTAGIIKSADEFLARSGLGRKAG